MTRRGYILLWTDCGGIWAGVLRPSHFAWREKQGAVPEQVRVQSAPRLQ